MTAVLKSNWNYPTRVWSGPGRIAELKVACQELSIARPLFVTDRGLKDHAMVRAALALVPSAALFADVKGNPVAANVDAGLAAYRAGGHDGVIAFGGGSALDAGKVIAFMSGQKRPLWDFEDVGDFWTRADPAGIAPVIAVPTTAGTGSEVGRAGVILNEATHQKKIIFHPKMMPGIVIADPELTVGLPAHLTAATGIDAFTHCFEAYCAPGFHPLADGIALEGMRLISEYLPRACANGADIEARSRMLAAASMGATAFQKGLGGVHAIAHPVGPLLPKDGRDRVEPGMRFGAHRSGPDHRRRFKPREAETVVGVSERAGIAAGQQQAGGAGAGAVDQRLKAHVPKCRRRAATTAGCTRPLTSPP